MSLDSAADQHGASIFLDAHPHSSVTNAQDGSTWGRRGSTVEWALSV